VRPGDDDALAVGVLEEAEVVVVRRVTDLRRAALFPSVHVPKAQFAIESHRGDCLAALEERGVEQVAAGAHAQGDRLAGGVLLGQGARRQQCEGEPA
jgi:hypothetical protein